MQEIIATSAYLRIQLQELESALKKKVRTCIDCDSFNAPAYSCVIYKQKVPAKVIIAGCDSFTNNIPF